jgi:hypothetical protein
MQIGRSGFPFIHLGVLKQQDHGFMNAHILSNLHAKQKWNEKKAFD